jgi:tRNA uridine 5-carbamoylmethylation protein Kti12
MESLDYCLKKLDLTYDEFDGIMSESPKSFKDYKSYHSLVKALKTPISWGNKVGIVPDTVYKKYFSFDI